MLIIVIGKIAVLYLVLYTTYSYCSCSSLAASPYEMRGNIGATLRIKADARIHAVCDLYGGPQVSDWKEHWRERLILPEHFARQCLIKRARLEQRRKWEENP